ncbi:MAG: Gfo/Idh/MocA family oxidoreductase [Pirellulales bacterium]|nr:Gfo/Idh/MocA family oxidoreductase [Pirellulales bacterium]
MTRSFNRRSFLKKTAAVAGAAGATSWLAAPYVLAEPSPNSKLNIAGIGVGGRGGAHVESSLSENLVAVCDVVEGTRQGAVRHAENRNQERHLDRPLPKAFADYRKMLDEMHKQIDAVFVATPDHLHAPAAMAAIKLGKHVYCEKPLTHNIDEARQLMLAAREHKVATQMGNQGRAAQGWRQLAEAVWAGAIGDVTEVHIWTDRPGIPSRFWWPQGGTRPAGSDPVPAGLDWDLWLGPAPTRPYLHTYPDGKFQGRPVYQPFVWRGWWDFGTGALGDIGCHALSGTFSALKIEYAAAVELVKDSGDTTDEMFPSSSIIRYDIPARGEMPPCKLFWYDGGYYPPRDVAGVAEGGEYPGNGKIVVGTQGKLTVGEGGIRLMPEEKMKDFQPPEPTIPRCQSDHFGEWVAACKGGRPAFSNFDHAGPLTEMVLLGNLAVRAGVGNKVEWDGPAMKSTNRPELNSLVRRDYRPGWEL